MKLSDVSVIIVNFNGEDVLPQAVASVLTLPDRPGELIVVDNGSTDGSLGFLHTVTDPLLKVVTLGENRGVAGGRNRGVMQAGGRVLAFLDSDGEATPSWLGESLAVLSAHPEAGAVAPLVLMEDGSVINGAGSFLDASGHGRDRLWGEPLDSHGADLALWHEQPVDYPMGCGMVIRRRGLDSLWPLDEALAKWHDDTEIGLRIRRLGYEVLFSRTAAVLHHPGHSDPKNPGERQLLAEMARLRLLWKYYPGPTALWASVHYAFFAVTGSRRRLGNWRDLAFMVRHLAASSSDLRRMRRRWRRGSDQRP